MDAILGTPRAHEDYKGILVCIREPEGTLTEHCETFSETIEVARLRARAPIGRAQHKDTY